MQLEWELLLAFPGIGGMQGICHIRTYEAPGYRPVVIAGELTDNPGTYIPNAIETLAHTIQEQLYSDGREFQLIQHRPPDEYLAVDFHHRSVSENPEDPEHLVDQLIIHGSFEDCREHVARYVAGGVDVPVLAVIPAGVELADAVAGLAPR